MKNDVYQGGGGMLGDNEGAGGEVGGAWHRFSCRVAFIEVLVGEHRQKKYKVY